MCPLFPKVEVDPLHSSRSFRKRDEECHVGDSFCVYVSQCTGCRTTQPRLIQSSLEQRRISNEPKGSLSLPHWPSLEQPYAENPLYLHIYIFSEDSRLKKRKNTGVWLLAIIAARWFWKPSDEKLMPRVSSLSLTQPGCPGREASSKLSTVSFAF